MLPTDFIIQARLNSSRLPGKIALILNNGESVIQTLIDRIQKYISYKDIKSRIFVACPENEEFFFKVLIKKNSCILVTGNEKNVAKRFNKVINEHSVEQFVRVTADNPFICFDVIDYIMSKKINNSFLCLSTYHQKLLPNGTVLSKILPEFINKIIKSDCELSKEHLILTKDNYLSSLIEIPDLPENLIWSGGRFCIDDLNDYFYLLQQKDIKEFFKVREFKEKLKKRYDVKPY
jgi:spore coat polysaccharide biosynthesis protein SpsF (cytidylyltransferase family)